MLQTDPHAVPTVVLPSHPTPFVGRVAEHAEITAILGKPACRLLTLLGPGGIGKTRLATQVVADITDNYDHGVFFIPLQTIQTRTLFLAAIADILDIPLTGQQRLQQLLGFLRGKSLLLLLDNFEQLLPENVTAVLAELLAGAPSLQLLVTSRAALNLQEEWVFTVQGLSVLPLAQTAEPTPHEAVQLFVERARRARPDFQPASQMDDIIHICRLVDGVPLALELAAGWTKMLSCAAIAAEIARDLDILTTSQHNVPDRQQSMRVIFDQTWQQLSQMERTVYKRLSVFQGGFTRAAATQVAGATLPLLSALQDKALLRWEEHGRFYVHELLRQYAAARLADSPTAWEQATDAHCTYFCAHLNQLNDDLMGPRQLAVTQEIEVELENIRAAWRWAVEQGHIPQIRQAAFPLGNFYQYQSRYAEGLDAFEPASLILQQMPTTRKVQLALIDTLMVRSWFYLRLGRLEEVKSVMVESQTIHRQLNIDPVPGYVTDPAVSLALVNLVQGKFAAAAAYAEQARQTGEQTNHLGNQMFAGYLLAQCTQAEGDIAAAKTHGQAAFAAAQSLQDRWFRAYILNTLADVALAENAFETARQQYEASYEIRHDFNDAEGMALALNKLSEIALRQEDYQVAGEFLERSLHLYQDIGDSGGLATTFNGLAHIALLQHDLDGARYHYRQALRLAAEIWYVPLLITLLVGIGELLCQAGRVAKGLALFALVRGHEAANQENKESALRVHNRYKLQLPGSRVTTVTQQAETANLEDTVRKLLVELPLLNLAALPAELESSPADPNQALVEPLTPRELDVLKLLAAGLSNREVGEQLVLAEGTIKYYTRQIYGKLQVRNRVQAIALAQELNLV